MRFRFDNRKLCAALVLWITFAQEVSATGVEPTKDLRVDPALCLAAALVRNDDRTLATCGALLDRIWAYMLKNGAIISKSPDANIGQYIGRVFCIQY